MIWLWILGVTAALLALLLLTRVGAQGSYKDGALTLHAKIGLLSIRLLPAKEKKTEKPRKKKEAPPKKPKQKVKFTFADIRDAAKTLWPPLKRALRRTRKGVRIHPLTLALTLGAADDPAAGAQNYGYIHSAVWTVMPVLEQLLVIPEPSIHVGLDFDTAETKAEGTFGLSARIGTLLGIVLSVAIPGLKWFLCWNKQKKRPTAPAEKTEQETAA